MAEGEKSLNETIEKINKKAKELEEQGYKMRCRHQRVTVLTILLGVTAPALVTFSITINSIITNVDLQILVQIPTVVITAFASAFATIKTVLRFSERYSNSALTSLALFQLANKIQHEKANALMLQEQFHQTKFFEIAAKGYEEFYKTNKNYVEQDVAAATQETQQLSETQKTGNTGNTENTESASSENNQGSK